VKRKSDIARPDPIIPDPLIFPLKSG